jgi:hypothetical protein
VEPRYNGLEHEEDVCAQRRLSALLARVAELARQRLADIMINVYPTICARTDGASRKSKPQSDRLLVAAINNTVKAATCRIADGAELCLNQSDPLPGSALT